MSDLLTPLRVLAYGTAAAVGLQLVGLGLSRLSGVAVRANGRLPRLRRDGSRRALVPGLAFLCAGLALVTQGIVVLAQALA